MPYPREPLAKSSSPAQTVADGSVLASTGSEASSLNGSLLPSRNNSGPLNSLGQLVSSPSGSPADALQRAAPPRRQVRLAFLMLRLVICPDHHGDLHCTARSAPSQS